MDNKSEIILNGREGGEKSDLVFLHLIHVLQQGGLSAALQWLGRWMQEKHGFGVELQIDRSMDPQPEDVTLLMFQAVRELLFNALEHGGVKSARVEMSRAEGNRLKVVVIDRGVGFDPSSIWEKAQAGTGFGLLSIRERIALSGGSLEIESSPGKGALFALIVPLEIPKEEIKSRIQTIIAKIQRSKKISDKIRVLIADDHAVFRDGLASGLNLHSDIVVVGEAADGEEAIKMAQEIEPDVILMDISLPKIDGIEATRIIHSELPRIRIIGLSMYEKEDQGAAMIEAGASAYRPKSENTDLLLAAIRGESK